jgi:hypothetical protein
MSGIWDWVVPPPRRVALVRTFTASVVGASTERKWSSATGTVKFFNAAAGC